MPMYYFHLRDDNHISDLDGTELADVDAAREHAGAVARELTTIPAGYKASLGRSGPWSCMTMTARNYFRSRCPMWKKVTEASDFSPYAVAMSASGPEQT